MICHLKIATQTDKFPRSASTELFAVEEFEVPILHVAFLQPNNFAERAKM